MNDLRGSNVPQEVKFGLKNKIVGAILVAAAVCTAAVYFATSGATAPVQPLAAHHGPDAVQTNVVR